MKDIRVNINDENQVELIGDALSSPIRRRILRLVCAKSYTIQDLSKITKVALSTMSFHLKILKEAGLIKLINAPGKRGNEKNVSHACESIFIKFSPISQSKKNVYQIEIPIGSYMNFDICPPCSMMGPDNQIGEYDNLSIFYSPERFNAQMISFFKGYLEYRISNDFIKDNEVTSFTFSLEICSECPNYNNQWKSHITFWINNVEICTYLSPGDFGDRRGIYNPSWYEGEVTQYGMLIKITINKEGTWIDNKLASNITINDIDLSNHKNYISLKFGVKDDSKYVGGLNLFGKSFGDYNQNILIQATFKDKESE